MSSVRRANPQAAVESIMQETRNHAARNIPSSLTALYPSDSPSSLRSPPANHIPVHALAPDDRQGYTALVAWPCDRHPCCSMSCIQRHDVALSFLSCRTAAGRWIDCARRYADDCRVRDTVRMRLEIGDCTQSTIARCAMGDVASLTVAGCGGQRNAYRCPGFRRLVLSQSGLSRRPLPPCFVRIKESSFTHDTTFTFLTQLSYK